MHVFVSAGEPSGDLHGSNLIRALKAREPNVRVAGFGGPRMEAAGAALLFQLTSLAVMWFRSVFAHIRQFVGLVKQGQRYFETERPDAVVLIDYPGFHYALAKRAKAAGVPVFYFVPPQLWAWAGWRARKTRRWVDTVLTALPFEEQWYAARGVRTRYVGHPYFDELATQTLDAGFLAAVRATPGPVVTLLPGSRDAEVAKNLPTMIAAGHKVLAARPDARLAVAAFNDRQAAVVREQLAAAGLAADVHVGRTPELIEAAAVCVAVSGSVGLEVMYRLKPAVVVYRITVGLRLLAAVLKKCEYISLVNLLAGEELYPEYAGTRDESAAVAADVLRWLNDPAAHAATVGKLRRLRDKVAVPGACERAAEFIVSRIRAAAAAPLKRAG